MEGQFLLSEQSRAEHFKAFIQSLVEKFQPQKIIKFGKQSKQLSSAAGKVFFRLPLETYTVKLTLKTLNIYSEFRRPKKPYLRINVRKIYFRKEVLTIGVKLDDEMEERVFIHVTEKELLVSCTVDTDETYLSRYAYFGLLEMMELAPVKSIFYQATEEEAEEFTNENAKREKVLFTLWQSCISLLHCQVHQSYYFTYGISNVEGKPRKKDLDYCKFSLEVPKLWFLLADKGDYYQLELHFKAHGKTFIPYEFNTAFFISSKTDPLTFYLLGSFADYKVTSFFARHKFKISLIFWDLYRKMN